MKKILFIYILVMLCLQVSAYELKTFSTPNLILPDSMQIPPVSSVYKVNMRYKRSLREVTPTVQADTCRTVESEIQCENLTPWIKPVLPSRPKSGLDETADTSPLIINPVKPGDVVTIFQNFMVTEILGVEDTGGQLRNVYYCSSLITPETSQYEQYLKLHFQDNLTDGEINGKIYIKYVVYTYPGSVITDGKILSTKKSKYIGCKYAIAEIDYNRPEVPDIKGGRILPTAFRDVYGTFPTISSLETASGGGWDYCMNMPENPDIQFLFPAYVFTWEKNTGSGWQQISSGFSDSLIYNYTEPESVQIRRKVTNCGKTAYSNICVLYHPATPSTSKNSLVKTVFNQGSDATFSINENIHYLDELGRSKQIVDHGGAPDGRDIVTHIAYDNMGRDDADQYLPYPESQADGLFKADAESRQTRYYASVFPETGSNGFAFVRNMYETSPLNRVLKSFNVGKIFRDKRKFVEHFYETNASNELLLINTRLENQFTVTGYYPAGKLSKHTVINEDGVTTVTYKNFAGNPVLERMIGTDTLDTYYVYDHKERLRWIITPKGSAELTQKTYTLSDELCKQFVYFYRYNGRDLMIQKKIPSKEIEYMVYDKADRLVLNQDGNLRPQNRWVHTVYDALGRITSQSIVETTLTQSELELACYSPAWNDLRPGRPSYIMLTTMIAELKQNKYGGPDSTTIPADLKFMPVPDIVEMADERTNGLLIYDKTYIIDYTPEPGLNPYSERAFYYDYKGRLVQTVEKTAFCDALNNSQILRTSLKYDFAGNILTRQEHRQNSNGTRPDIATTTSTYDHRNRLLTETTNLNGATNAYVQYAYDALGRLTSETTDAGTTSYKYNIQGWLTEKSSPQFSMNLSYYSPSVSESYSSFSGNISEISWQQGEDAPRNSYAFAYDRFSQLADARHYENGTPRNRFGERMAYDKNGNILRLMRGVDYAQADVQIYTYYGNQLSRLASGPVIIEGEAEPYSDTTPFSGSLTDETMPFAAGKNSSLKPLLYFDYDANGNMTFDSNAQLSIEYNPMNLIKKVRQSDRLLANYVYLSDGRKLMAVDSMSNGLSYIGSLVYTRQNGKLRLESTGFSGGRIVSTQTSGPEYFEPRYFFTDHLGSVRAITDMDGNVLERSDYYPFGMRWNDAQNPVSDNRYRYNGKEEQAFVSVPYTDYGARMYNPKLGRWFNVDPLAEKYYPISPYAFCVNNPMKYVDTDGRKILDANGQQAWTQKAGWATNVHPDTRRIGNAMMKTYIGQSVWRNMADVEYDITLKIDPGVHKTRALGTTDVHRDGDKIVGADITIYEGSINLQIEPQYSALRAKQLRAMSEDDRIGTIAVHEGVHGTDETPSSGDNSPDSPREQNARAAENKHAKELKRQEQKPIASPEEEPFGMKPFIFDMIWR